MLDKTGVTELLNKLLCYFYNFSWAACLKGGLGGSELGLCFVVALAHKRLAVYRNLALERTHVLKPAVAPVRASLSLF
jgi:hypothetical protein